MTPLVIVLPDDLQAFLETEVAAKGYRDANAYIAALLQDARDKAVATRLDTLLLAGLATKALPLDRAIRDALGGDASDAASASAFIHPAAVTDVVSQFNRYVAQGVPAIARRFLAALDRALTTPEAGVPHPSGSPALAGITRVPMRGFSDHHAYVLAEAERLTVVRVLHAKRDLA